MSAWWTQQESGLIFGLAGGGVGLLGAALGCCAPLMRRGRARGVVVGLHALGGALGAAGLCVGVAALSNGQPFHVWFPPLNLGLLCVGLFVGLYFAVTRRAYAAAEQRRLDAALMRPPAGAAALALALAVCATGERAAAGRVIVERVEGVKSVAVITAFDAGFVHDPAGVAQMAHLCEHLRATAATGTLAQGEAMRVAGGSNAETLPHFMYFDRVCPVETIGAALTIERGRFEDLRFDQGDVVREGPRCAGEVDALEAGEGLHLAKFALMAALQGWRHGMAHANVRTGLEAIPAEDARRFIDRELSADACTLVIVGDLEEDALREAGERALAGLPGSGRRAPVEVPEWSRQPKERGMTWDVRARGVFVCAPAPEDPVERAALSLYSALMAERYASGLPRGARSGVMTSPTWPMGELPFLVFASLPVDASAADATAELHAFLDRELERGVTEADAQAMRAMVGWLTAGGPTAQAGAAIEAARARGGAEGARAEAMAVGNIALRHVVADQFERQGAPAAEAAKLSPARMTELLRAALARERRFVTTLGPK